MITVTCTAKYSPGNIFDKSTPEPQIFIGEGETKSIATSRAHKEANDYGYNNGLTLKSFHVDGFSGQEEKIIKQQTKVVRTADQEKREGEDLYRKFDHSKTQSFWTIAVIFIIFVLGGITAIQALNNLLIKAKAYSHELPQIPANMWVLGTIIVLLLLAVGAYLLRQSVSGHKNEEKEDNEK